MTYIYKRGKGIDRRVFHLVKYNHRGELIGSLCNAKDLDTTCNLPLGKRICKLCNKKWKN